MIFQKSKLIENGTKNSMHQKSGIKNEVVCQKWGELYTVSFL